MTETSSSLPKFLDLLKREPSQEILMDDTLETVGQQLRWQDSKEYPKTIANHDLEQDDVSRKERADRGFATRDTWSLDYYLARWLPEALQVYKVGAHPGWICWKEQCQDCLYSGPYPRLTDLPVCHCQEVWAAIVEEMIVGFQERIKLADCDYNYNSPEYKEAQKKVRRGRKLFLRYFDSLWD